MKSDGQLLKEIRQREHNLQQYNLGLDTAAREIERCGDRFMIAPCGGEYHESVRAPYAEKCKEYHDLAADIRRRMLPLEITLRLK